MIIPITELEEVLGIQIKRNCKSLGIDSASKLGWAITETDDTNVYIRCGSIDAKSIPTHKRYIKFIEFFNELIDDSFDKLIIEDCHLKYFGRKPQVNVLKVLSRVGMIPLVIGRLKGISKLSQIGWIRPNVARATLGLNGTAKKSKVHAQFWQKTGIELEDEDMVDAIILAINGLMKKGKK